ncbi:MAG TPA: oligosaccharide flippase family protein [Xanthobacteraceae bacterium]|nr:oligosaccharide flippase family protein [Xanthobacteraceae bacterium]
MASRILSYLSNNLIATVLSFALQALIRLGSSMVLTRILLPEAYGIITIITSIAFVVEMIADTNATLFIIREENGDQPRYVNTAWTIQISRAVFNSAILFLLAPLVATWIYHLPALIAPMRVFSLSFIIGGLQSMSFPLAIRRKQARIIVYSELAAAFASALFSVGYCYFYRNYWGMIYGILINRALLSLLSRQFYPDLVPRFQFDRAAARDLLGLSKYTMPSSVLTLVINQFDKVIFLRLFDLRLLGIYGLAGNIAGSVSSLISKISQTVLYPRCAHSFRTNRSGFALAYYRDNIKLFISMMLLPAALGGAAQLVITILYPATYAQAGVVLQAFMMRAGILAFAAPAEDLLIAAGDYKVILHGNVFRVIALFGASLVGYRLFGFLGFVYGTALSGMAPLAYYWWLQRRNKMMILKYEAYKLGFALVLTLSAHLTSGVILHLWPTISLRHL